MRRGTAALIYGLAMFGTAFGFVAIGAIVVVALNGIEPSSDVAWLITRKAAFAGFLTGAPSFLLAYFGSHRKIGRS